MQTNSSLEKSKTFENFPRWIIITSNFVLIAIYAIGAYIIYQLGLIWLILYLLYILWQEIRVMQKSCVNCYYYGKYCAFGKGKISARFFKKGNSEDFCKRQATWKDILPSFLVSIIPLIIGIIILILKFNWLLLILILVLIILTSYGNAFVRGSLACKYCKQRELGCPAEQLFNKKR